MRVYACIGGHADSDPINSLIPHRNGPRLKCRKTYNQRYALALASMPFRPLSWALFALSGDSDLDRETMCPTHYCLTLLLVGENRRKIGAIERRSMARRLGEQRVEATIRRHLRGESWYSRHPNHGYYPLLQPQADPWFLEVTHKRIQTNPRMSGHPIMKNNYAGFSPK